VRRAQAPPSGSRPEERQLEPGFLRTNARCSELGPSPRVLWRPLLPAHGAHREYAAVQPKDLDATVEAAHKGHLLEKNRCEELHTKNLEIDGGWV